MKDGTGEVICGRMVVTSEPNYEGRWTEAAFTWLNGFIKARSLTERQASLLTYVLDGYMRYKGEPSALIAVEMPMRVYSAAGGKGHPPLPLAAGCLCLYLGADILDDLSDHDLPQYWKEYGEELAVYAGLTMLCPLTMQIFTELDLAPAEHMSLNEALADALCEMSAGQVEDLLFEQNKEADLASCEKMMEQKSGAEMALFARAGALAAHAPEESCAAYEQFGRHFGVMCQILTDCMDLFAEDETISVADKGRKLTLPILYALNVLDPGSRKELLAHLATIPSDPGRLGLMRRILLDAGALSYGVLAAETYRRRALKSLHSIGSAGEGHDNLCSYVVGFSLL